MIGLCGTIDPVEVYPNTTAIFGRLGLTPVSRFFYGSWSKGMTTEVEDGTVESKQVEESAAMAATLSLRPEVHAA